jgi:hypothetical protein
MVTEGNREMAGRQRPVSVIPLEPMEIARQPPNHSATLVSHVDKEMRGPGTENPERRHLRE